MVLLLERGYQPMTEYYRLMIDPDTKDLWFLSGPVDGTGIQIDPRIFTCCTRYNTRSDLTIPIGNIGIESFFNFSAFGMLVSERGLNAELETVLCVEAQRIPVAIPGARHDYEILNVLDCIDCIDEKRSALSKWRKEHGRLEKVGQYKMVYELVIDSARAEGHHLFRVAGWNVALICSERARHFFERLGVVGVTFQSVT